MSPENCVDCCFTFEYCPQCHGPKDNLLISPPIFVNACVTRSQLFAAISATSKPRSASAVCCLQSESKAGSWPTQSSKLADRLNCHVAKEAWGKPGSSSDLQKHGMDHPSKLGVFLPPVRKWATPSKRNPSLRGGRSFFHESWQKKTLASET